MNKQIKASNHRRPSSLIVGVGDEGMSDGLRRWVVERSTVRPRPVRVVHSWHGHPHPVVRPGESVAASRDSAVSQPAAEAAARLRTSGIDATALTSQDDAASAVLRQAGTDDEVALGMVEGHPLKHAWMRSVIHDVLRHALSPVVVVPDSWRPGIETPRVLVGDDQTVRTEPVLVWAFEEAARLRARVEILRAQIWQRMLLVSPQDKHARSDRLDALAASVGLADLVVRDLPADDAGVARALADATKGAHLMVLGNHRPNWIAKTTQLSVTEAVLWRSHCPVAIVPMSEHAGEQDVLSESAGHVATA